MKLPRGAEVAWSLPTPRLSRCLEALDFLRQRGWEVSLSAEGCSGDEQASLRLGDVQQN